MGTTFGMNKKQRVQTFASGSSHAMTLMAVDLDKDGKPKKWMVENSWGAEAALVSVVRILVIGFMFGNLFSILYSLAGAALSMTVMTLMLKKTSFSLIGVSVAGGVSHNIGQLIIAMLIVQNASVFVYAPALLVAGVAAGVVIGGLTNEILKRVHL